MQRRLAWQIGRKFGLSTFGRAEKHRRDCRCCAAGSASSNVHRDEERGCESQWTERCGTREQRVGVGLNFAEIFAHATPADQPRPLPVLLSADTNLVGRCVATARPPVATAKFRVDRTTRKPKQHETDDAQATIGPSSLSVRVVQRGRLSRHLLSFASSHRLGMSRRHLVSRLLLGLLCPSLPSRRAIDWR